MFKYYFVQGAGFMCDTDLIDIGVTDADDRCRLLSAVSRLPTSLHSTRESLCLRIFSLLWHQSNLFVGGAKLYPSQGGGRSFGPNGQSPKVENGGGGGILGKGAASPPPSMESGVRCKLPSGVWGRALENLKFVATSDLKNHYRNPSQTFIICKSY